MKHIPRYLSTILLTLLIGWLTLSPKPLGSVDVPLFPGADKLAHGLMFGFLALCVAWDFRSRKRGYTPRLLAWDVLYCGALGFLTEWLQHLMSVGRTFEWEDGLSDLTGAAVVAIFLYLYQLKRR